MAVYARLGNQTQVVRIYEHCIERLRAELGVPPATVAVYDDLRFE